MTALKVLLVAVASLGVSEAICTSDNNVFSVVVDLYAGELGRCTLNTSIESRTVDSVTTIVF